IDNEIKENELENYMANQNKYQSTYQPSFMAAQTQQGLEQQSSVVLGSEGMPIGRPVGINLHNDVSKKKQEEIDQIMTSIKDKPDYHIDYFNQRQRYKTVKDKSEAEKGKVRSAAGKIWKDPTMEEWDENDFRIFVGNIGYEIVDEHLIKAFSKYDSFQKAKVIRDRRSFRSKGYGFVSFKDPDDFLRALKEMDGQYIGVKPIKLLKSNWKVRNIEVVKKKNKERKKIGLK
ncbi:MAG: hypothetical protein MHPSP_000592, partial [Paramarteilia canceri]